MTNEDFEKLSADLMAECLETLNKKGPEYSGTEDRLANFKRIAEEEQIDPITVGRIYQRKHIDAVNTFNQTLWGKGYEEASKHLSEPIRGRIVDVINYYILLYALFEEQNVCQTKDCRDCLYNEIPLNQNPCLVCGKTHSKWEPIDE